MPQDDSQRNGALPAEADGTPQPDASELRYGAIIDATPVPMALNDEQQRITFLNSAFVRTFGYTREDIPTLAEWWPRAYPDPGYRDWVSNAWQVELERAKRTGTAFTPMELAVRGKDGTTRTVLASAASLAGSFQGTHLVVLYDISDRKSAEAERAKLEAQLHQAQKMESIGRLAGGIAHDFNNVLGVILGHAELALEHLDPSHVVYDDIAEIQKAAERSASLTRQLLAFARKQTVVPKRLDLNDTLRGMLKMLQHTIGENITLEWKPGAGVWPVRIDRSQLDQVLANLCVNARDAISGVGRISIETGNRSIDAAYSASHQGYEPGEYASLTVRDDGHGMDAETLAHAFEPFFSTKEVGRGTGLGLATVYGIVKQNGGCIDVRSEPGSGTTFSILLPRHSVEAEEISTPTATLLRGGRETLLLAEDEAALRSALRRRLERLGYEVLTADTPGEVIRLAREHRGQIHLLLTDVVMPEMNGRDLAENILALHPAVSVLFMSGYTADVIAREGVLDEGVSFLQKPFSEVELAAAVREALDR